MSRPRRRRAAVYTRKSTDSGLEQDFNSLDAQREACAAYIKSQAQEGWQLVPDRYDDGGLSGASLERPALRRMLGDIEAGRVDIVVVYKVDRLTRSLTDFAKLIDLFDQHTISFVSVTQQFNTTSSMGRLTLNVLLSFAQFEREVISERISAPTVGIGAGAGCDAQILVTHDVLGFKGPFHPRFVRRYADVEDVIAGAARAFAADVENGTYPSGDESFAMPAETLERLRDRWREERS